MSENGSVVIVFEGQEQSLQDAIAKVDASLEAFAKRIDQAATQTRTLGTRQRETGQESIGLTERLRTAAEAASLLGRESSEATGKLFALGDVASRLHEHFGGLAAGITAGLGSFAAFGLVDFLKASVEEAVHSQGAWDRLTASYKGNAAGLQQVKDQIENATASWHRYGLTAAQVAGLVAQARGRNVSAQTVIGNPAALKDLSIALKTDIPTALDLITRSGRGTQQVLSKLNLSSLQMYAARGFMNVTTDATARAQYILNLIEQSRFRGQGDAMANTVQGKAAALHTSLADLEDKIGQVAIPALGSIADSLTHIVDGVNKASSSFGGLGKILQQYWIPIFAGGIILTKTLLYLFGRMAELIGSSLLGGFQKLTQGVQQYTDELNGIPSEVTTTAIFDDTGAVKVKEPYIANVKSVPTETHTTAHFNADQAQHAMKQHHAAVQHHAQHAAHQAHHTLRKVATGAAASIATMTVLNVVLGGHALDGIKRTLGNMTATIAHWLFNTPSVTANGKINWSGTAPTVTVNAPSTVHVKVDGPSTITVKNATYSGAALGIPAHSVLHQGDVTVDPKLAKNPVSIPATANLSTANLSGNMTVHAKVVMPDLWNAMHLDGLPAGTGRDSAHAVPLHMKPAWDGLNIPDALKNVGSIHISSTAVLGGTTVNTKITNWKDMGANAGTQSNPFYVKVLQDTGGVGGVAKDVGSMVLQALIFSLVARFGGEAVAKMIGKIKGPKGSPPSDGDLTGGLESQANDAARQQMEYQQKLAKLKGGHPLPDWAKNPPYPIPPYQRLLPGPGETTGGTATSYTGMPQGPDIFGIFGMVKKGVVGAFTAIDWGTIGHAITSSAGTVAKIAGAIALALGSALAALGGVGKMLPNATILNPIRGNLAASLGNLLISVISGAVDFAKNWIKSHNPFNGLFGGSGGGSGGGKGQSLPAIPKNVHGWWEGGGNEFETTDTNQKSWPPGVPGLNRHWDPVSKHWYYVKSGHAFVRPSDPTRPPPGVPVQGIGLGALLDAVHGSSGGTSLAETALLQRLGGAGAARGAHAGAGGLGTTHVHVGGVSISVSGAGQPDAVAEAVARRFVGEVIDGVRSARRLGG